MMDFIIDFETFSQNECKCAVIDCSILFFDWNVFTSDSGYSFEQLLKETVTLKLDVKSQVDDRRYEIDPDTLEFWKGVSPIVRKRIVSKAGDLSVREFCDQFIKLVQSKPKAARWWSRANNFDPPILFRLMRDCGAYDTFKKVVPFYNVRDTRTFIDAKFDFSTRNDFIPISDEQYWNDTFQHHNSSHDIVADVLRLQTIKRAEDELPQIER